MNFIDTLSGATATGRQALYEVPQIKDALDGTISLSMYVDFLAQAYHHVKHTVPLLSLARKSLRPHQADFRAALSTRRNASDGHGRDGRLCV